MIGSQRAEADKQIKSHKSFLPAGQTLAKETQLDEEEQEEWVEEEGKSAVIPAHAALKTMASECCLISERVAEQSRPEHREREREGEWKGCLADCLQDERSLRIYKIDESVKM